MERFVIIGLGQFGTRLATNLASMGREVIAIDRRRDRVEGVSDAVTLAVALDATDESALRAQGVEQADVAVVGMGEGFESVVLCTAVLKQMGVPRVVSRATNPVEVKVLMRVGADEVVNPEDESADRWASRLYTPFFVSQFALDDRHSIVEIPSPKAWVGKTLIDIRPRNELGVHVLAIKRDEGEGDEKRIPRIHIPDPTEPLREDDVLIMMGLDDALTGIPVD